MITDTQDICDIHLTDSLDDGIIITRMNGKVATNVPHLMVHHSLTGFEFGYGGSGPADLALNCVEIILNRMAYQGKRIKCHDGNCWDLAWTFHQDFKRTFIATLDHDAGGVIPYEVAEQWVIDAMETQHE